MVEAEINAFLPLWPLKRKVSASTQSPALSALLFFYRHVVGRETGDEKQEVLADPQVENPRDIMHCWYNESSEPLRFIVVKAPRPTTRAVFIED